MNKKYFNKHIETHKHTFNLFQQISPLEWETKHCDVCSQDVLKVSYKKHLQSHKHKKNEEGILGYYIENIDEAFKRHIKIWLFHFKKPTPTSIIEVIDMVKPSIEILFKTHWAKSIL